MIASDGGQPVEQRRAAGHHDGVHQVAVALDDFSERRKVTVKDRLLAGLKALPCPGDARLLQVAGRAPNDALPSSQPLYARG